MKAYCHYFGLAATLLTSGCHYSSEKLAATENLLVPINVLLAPPAFADTLAALPDEQLLDVRTPAEYRSGHLPQATLMNFREDGFEEKLAQLDKDQPVMVYCAGGGRSHQAAAMLEKLGFQKVYELEGGMKNWVDSGEAVEK